MWDSRIKGMGQSLELVLALHKLSSGSSSISNV